MDCIGVLTKSQIPPVPARNTIWADPEGRASGTRHHSLFTPTRLKAGTARMYATHVGRLGGRAGHVGRLRGRAAPIGRLRGRVGHVGRLKDRATCVGELIGREAAPDESRR